MNAPSVLGINFSRSAHAAKPADVVVAEVCWDPRSHTDRDGQLLSQIPPSIGRDIVYLMAELGYVQVVTMSVRSLVLYNPADPIAEMPADAGI